MTRRKPKRTSRRHRSPVAPAILVTVLTVAVAALAFYAWKTRPAHPPAPGPNEQVTASRPAAATAARSGGPPAAEPIAAPGSLAGMNVLLLTLDTTRADHLHCYGRENIATPTLDRLADQGILFLHATAAAPTTVPAHSSILTGLYPAHHGVRVNGAFRLPDKLHTLAEMLRDAGYQTAAVISAFVLDRQFGLAQGFQRYDDDLSKAPEPINRHYREWTADHTTNRACAQLRRLANQRFFLWVHYFDPHREYQPPEPYRHTYAQNLYDGEIAFMDTQIGLLIDTLRELGLDKRTLVVVVGDHGESLGAHGEATHGYLVYQPTLHVPLIMSCPGHLAPGRRFAPRVSQVDIVPTVLGLLGIRKPTTFDGTDLTTALPARRPLLFETLHGALTFGWAPLAGTFIDSLKYIDGPHPELYDLTRDPLEQHNLCDTRPDDARRLAAIVAQTFGEHLARIQNVRPNLRPGAQDLRKLEALGYVGVGSETPADAGPPPDPKSMMAALDRAERAADPELPLDESIKRLQAVVKEFPNLYPAWRYLGDACRRAKRLDEAADALEHCLKLRSGLPDTTYALALVRANQGHKQQAIELCRKIVERFPDHLRARYLLGTLLAAQGNYASAIEHLRRAFELDPTYKQCLPDVIAAYAATGRNTELLKLLAGHLDTHPDATSVRLALIIELTKRRAYDQVNKLYRDGLRIDPDNGTLVSRFALFLMQCPLQRLRDPQRALALLAGYCRRANPPDPPAMLTLSTIYATLGRMDDALRTARQGRDLAAKTTDRKLLQRFEHLLRRLEAARRTPRRPTRG